MILWRFGPKRLSPSLVVWQVRHALLNVSCPDSGSATLRAGSWGTAGKPRSIRNVVQINPKIVEHAILRDLHSTEAIVDDILISIIFVDQISEFPPTMPSGGALRRVLGLPAARLS